MNLNQVQKNFFGIKISLLFFLTLIIISSYAQTGLNFQGVARNNNNVIIASQQISVRLSILQGSTSGIAEYSETRTLTTNAQGLFTVVIGDVGATTSVGNFGTINWKNTPKYLKIEMDAIGGNNFITMGTTQFQYVAYAHFAKSVDAENISGIVSVTRGGTGTNSLSDLKSNLEIDKINNTADADKPVSSRMLSALNLKLNITDTGLYTKKAWLNNALVVKLNVTDTALMLSSRITRDTASLSSRINDKANSSDIATSLAVKVDKVTGKELSTNDFTTVEKNKLASIIGTNTGDQVLPTLSSLGAVAGNTAIVASVGTKITYDSKGLVTVGADATTADIAASTNKNYVTDAMLSGVLSNTSGVNTGDQDLSDYATNTVLALKANTTDVNVSLALKASTTNVATSLALKEDATNKSTAADLGGLSPSDLLFPTQKAVKDYVTANAASGSIADGGITTIKLADAAITNAKISDVDASKIIGTLAIANGGTGTITTTANAIFAGPDGSSGAPSFRALTSSDIPANLTGYIQNSPSATQTATIKINGTITANGIKMTTGINNIALGIDALNNNTSGYSNSAFGISALNSNTSGYRNSAFGEYSLKLNTSGYFNSAFGAESLAFNTTGWSNNAFGFRSLYQNTTGTNNAAFGNWAMFVNLTGTNNAAFGMQSLYNNLTGSNNNAFGIQSLYNNSTGYSNNVFGYQAMLANIDGYNNSAFGDQTLRLNTTGAANSAFGAGAMFKNTTANFNSAFGAAALYTNTTGIANAAFGNKALYATTTGYDNAAFGSQSMFLNTEGIGNAAIGVMTLQNNTTGSGNTAVGKLALGSNLTGSYNVAIGFGADVDAGAYTNAIAIGYGAIATGSNKIQLGNSSITNITTNGAITAGSIQNTPIGSVTPSLGAFTSISASNNLLLNSILIGKDPNNIEKNTVMGNSAMFSNITGDNNTAIGYQTLKENTSGGHNSAIGYISLYKNTEGYGNTSLGSYSLYHSTTGYNNTAMGFNSGTNLATGSYNTYLGAFANNTGIGDILNSTAIGYQALVNYSNTIQLGNTSVTNVNTSGSITAGSIQNTPIGTSIPSFGIFSSLESTADLTISGVKIGIGAGSNYTNAVFGNDAFISNTTGVRNIAVGSDALKFNTTGVDNIALGYLALQQNTIGSDNFAAGYQSLLNNSIGVRNVAIGSNSLKVNTTGTDNIALGRGTLMSNISGLSDIAIGYNNLNSNTTGSYNLAIGNSTLLANTVGDYNIAIGSQTLSKISGTSSYNVGIGAYTLSNTTLSTGNTSIGDASMLNNTIGELNTVIGYHAGNSITTGRNNIVIGSNAATSNGAVSNEIVLGNSSNSIIRSQVTSITALSDARDKKNIQNLTVGLDFIKSLKPRMFNWDKREWYNNNTSDGSKISKELTAGFIAQELDASQNTFNADWLKLVYKSSIDRMEATYGNLLPVIVKAIQEESEIIKSLSVEKDTEILDLKERVKALEVMIDKIIKQKSE